ncbi:MAG: hypothetical protein ABSH53_01030 [Holophaga sp.]
MVEILRCPGCSTPFVLAPARVRPGIRRAKCFRCSSVFGIEETVARLLAPAPAPAVDVPSFSFDDLQEPASETLHLPVPALEAVPSAEEAALAGGAGYLSAKDAIEKLLGQAPAAQVPARMASRGAMDVEATLNALESTLGGHPGAEAPLLQPAPAPPQAEPPQPAPAPDLASTVKLTSEELRLAMTTMAPPSKAPEPPRPAPRPVEPSIPPAGPDSAPAQELLKIQLEQETCNNVTLEQMTAWIEQGRVHEYHMVARQYSDHWIEASKVPALRPVFDRLRKARTPQAEEPARPAPEPAPVKRGLFGGLFGRN